MSRCAPSLMSQGAIHGTDGNSRDRVMAAQPAYNSMAHLPCTVGRQLPFNIADQHLNAHTAPHCSTHSFSCPEMCPSSYNGSASASDRSSSQRLCFLNSRTVSTQARPRLGHPLSHHHNSHRTTAFTARPPQQPHSHHTITAATAPLVATAQTPQQPHHHSG